VASQFCFGFHHKKFILLKLPFGWNKSPSVFKSIIDGIVDAFLAVDTVVILVYMDDFLLASRSPGDLAKCTLDFVKALEARDLVVSYDKSILSPVLCIEWLGKHISSTVGGISIRCDGSDIVDCWAIFLWVCSKYWPRPVLRQLAGLVTWCSIHHRLALPFLSPGHRFIHWGGAVPDGNTRRSLAEAIYFAAMPAYRPFFFVGSEVPREVPWICFDANCSAGYAGVVISDLFAGVVYSESFKLPSFISKLEERGQQLAELYALKLAYMKAVCFSYRSVVFIGDSQSSLASALNFSTV